MPLQVHYLQLVKYYYSKLLFQILNAHLKDTPHHTLTKVPVHVHQPFNEKGHSILQRRRTETNF